MARRALFITLGAVLWASQLVLAIHALEHLAGQEEQGICEFCLAAASLDHLKEAPAVTVPTLPQPTPAPSPAKDTASHGPRLAVPARGPPLQHLG